MSELQDRLDALAKRGVEGIELGTAPVSRSPRLVGALAGVAIALVAVVGVVLAVGGGDEPETLENPPLTTVAPAPPTTGDALVSVGFAVDHPLEEPIVFMEGFKLEVRFEAADGTVLATREWDRDDITSWWSIDEMVPAGTVRVVADFQVGFDPPRDVCVRDVPTEPGARSAVLLKLDARDECARVVEPNEIFECPASNAVEVDEHIEPVSPEEMATMQAMIGADVDDVIRVAQENEWAIRIIARDGRCLGMEDDLRSDRVNLELDGETVVGVGRF